MQGSGLGQTGGLLIWGEGNGKQQEESTFSSFTDPPCCGFLTTIHKRYSNIVQFQLLRVKSPFYSVAITSNTSLIFLLLYMLLLKNLLLPLLPVNFNALFREKNVHFLICRLCTLLSIVPMI